MIRALVLDYGGVLSRPQGEAELRELAGILGTDPTSLREAYWTHRPEYDRGALDASAYWQAVARSLDRPPPGERLGELVRADAASWGQLDAQAVAWARGLAARLPAALLSNMPRELRDLLRPAILAAVPFAVTLFSCDLGAIKPERAIYARCAALLGVAPGEALLVDDRPENVEGARRAGMRAVHFTSLQRAAEEVAAVLEAGPTAATGRRRASHAGETSGARTAPLPAASATGRAPGALFPSHPAERYSADPAETAGARSMTDGDPRHRVRQLLVSGDNILKNRTGPKAVARARERYERAREVAVSAGVDEGLIAIIDRRLGDLPVVGA